MVSSSGLVAPFWILHLNTPFIYAFVPCNATSIACPKHPFVPKPWLSKIPASSLDPENLRPAPDTIKDARVVYRDILFRYDLDNFL
jgi:hypothetical protein